MSNAWESYELVALYEQFTHAMAVADNRGTHWLVDQVEPLPDPPRHGLDLGCGTGRWSRMLREYWCSTVTGVDTSPLMLSKASVQTDLPGVSYREEAIGAVTETADVVLCMYALHHAGEVAAMLRHIRSLVRPGGVLAILTLTNPGGWKHPDYHTERAARLTALVAERVGVAAAKSTNELLTHPAWLDVVLSSTPPTPDRLVWHAQRLLPGGTVTRLGPETAGVMWHNKSEPA